MDYLRLHKFVGLVALITAILAAMAFFMPSSARELVTNSSKWTATGAFQRAHPWILSDPEILADDRGTSDLWDSTAGGSDVSEITSPAFRAPQVLEAWISGYPGEPGVHIFLQAEDGSQRSELFIRHDSQPAGRWQKFHWWVPRPLQGKMIRLAASDQSSQSAGWIGIGKPRQLTIFGLLCYQSRAAFVTFGVYLFNYGLFILPGIALLTIRPIRNALQTPVETLILIVATGATLGYISFWTFFFAKPTGRLFTNFVYLTSVCALLVAKPLGVSIKAAMRGAGVPLSYAGLAGLFYICAFFVVTNPAASLENPAGRRFFAEVRPGDNLIPKIFADRLYSHESVQPFCCGDWLSSDRPPLQTGIVLLERPLRITGNLELNYELMAVALQSLWICGVWCVLSSLGTSSVRIRETLAFLIFSGFCFYNTVYTWPKFLAAAFILLSLSLLFEAVRRRQRLTWKSHILAGLCLGCGLMAHTGSVLSLVIFVALIFRFRNLFSVRRALVVACLLALFVVPWSAYQKFVDPPGNRLLKIHVGGDQRIDSRSAWQVIQDSYRNHTWSDIVRFKVSNLLLLGGKDALDTFGVGTQRLDEPARERSRISQREWIWNAVGILNAGWVAWLILRIRRKNPVEPAIPYAGWLIGGAAANFIFWSLITFGPDETVTTHSSYADILLLGTGLTGFVLTLPWFVRRCLLSLQIFNLSVIWIWWGNAPNASISTMLQWPLMLAGGLAMAILLRFNTEEAAQPTLETSQQRATAA